MAPTGERACIGHGVIPIEQARGEFEFIDADPGATRVGIYGCQNAHTVSNMAAWKECG